MILNLNDQNNFWVYGEALLDNGLCEIVQTNGVGLVTRGLIWQVYDVWFDNQAKDGVSTSWTNDNATITTAWTNDNASITTTWTSVSGGIWGEATP